MKPNKFFLAGCVITLLWGCTHPAKEGRFRKAASSETGIHFSNNITESDSVNAFVNEYVYAGGGVGIGDFNNDGLPDVFFTGNQVSSRLYINTGKNHFDDVTRQAGLLTTSWCTGVSIIDINNDGFDDIYCCVSGNESGKPRRNLLFINQHNLTFIEQAQDYGLAYSGYSTQAVFFDYDKDGDLDMYLLNHRLDKFRPNDIVPRDTSGNSPAADRLFRNTGTDPIKHHPVYEDVSLKAGIREDGYGLGVALSDFNNDNWPDIYVSNDYLGNDELWLNNKNGTFTNCIGASVKHQSYSGMGVDAADINNDGRPDVMTLDMMPQKNSRKKTMYSFLSYERYQMERDEGYEPEFIRNMLQLNNGVVRRKGDTSMPSFSEIGQLAGVSETDWSWSVLLGDLDNDGWKDIYITNGIWRDLTNADFVAFRADRQMEDNSSEDQRKTLIGQLNSYKPILLPNYFYHNNGNFTFSDVSSGWGDDKNTASNGAAYADLDNDGDLDLIINNMNGEASVLINTSEAKAADSSHYLDCILHGSENNKAGIGARISIFYGGYRQVLEQYPARGYLSSVDKRLHFGLGKRALIDSLTVQWPDDKCQTIKSIQAGQALILNYAESHEPAAITEARQEFLFEDITEASHAMYHHQETFFNDYSIQRLLPQKYSQPGPSISAADVNGDGLIDFFIGGAYNFAGELYIQNKKGTFSSSPLVTAKKEEEDTGSDFFDADGNGTKDLLVGGGSDEFSPGSPVYKPRLYLNDGKGNFVLDDTAVPASVNTSASVVTAEDFDNDGNTEIFIGGRVSANFPVSPPSYILRNIRGKLMDVTEEVCPALKTAGMVTSAVWTDFDNDRHTDLIITGEWMPLRFFRNTNGKLTEVTSQSGLEAQYGQWRSLVACDIDRDGDIDLIAGNLGLNNKYKVSPHQPLMLYAEDIDHNGTLDPVTFYYIKNEKGEKQLYPSISRDLLSEQVPSVKKKFQYYRDYASAAFADIYPTAQKDELLTLQCAETRTCVMENTGKGKFIMHELPNEAQFAPVNAIACEDFDGDGIPDLLLAGNEYQTEIMTGRYDASYGLFLKGDGKCHFTPVDPGKSGFILNGDVKSLKVIPDAKGGLMVLAGINDDYMKVFRVNRKDIGKRR